MKEYSGKNTLKKIIKLIINSIKNIENSPSYRFKQASGIGIDHIDIRISNGNGLYLVIINGYNSASKVAHNTGMYIVGFSDDLSSVSYREILNHPSTVSFEYIDKGFRVNFNQIQNFCVEYMRITTG